LRDFASVAGKVGTELGTASQDLATTVLFLRLVVGLRAEAFDVRAYRASCHVAQAKSHAFSRVNGREAPNAIGNQDMAKHIGYVNQVHRPVLDSPQRGSQMLRMHVAFLALSLLLGLTISAQVAAINGQIEGVITDSSGSAITKAEVHVESRATGYSKSEETNDAGLFRFPLLPLGTYQLSVTAPGFSTEQRRELIVNAGSIVTVNVALTVGTVRSAVTVVEGSPVVDPSQTALGTTVSSNQVSNLPLVSRNPYNFILIQPNVAGRPNTEFGVPRKINANGFAGRINYQVDGGNNTESDRAGIRLIPFSDTFVQEIESVNNGFAPEFGNTVGTVFNTITKSGSNDLHGEGAYLFRRTDLSARPALLAPNLPSPQTNVDTLFGNLGGRIIKNKLFYFAGVEHVKRDLPTIVTVSPSNISQLSLPASYAGAIPFSQDVLFFQGKLDYQINDANRLSVRANGHRNDSPYNNGGGLVLVSQTYNFVDRSNAGSMQLVSSITSQALNEVRVQVPYRLQRQNPFTATGTGPSITISGVAQFGGSPNLDFLYKEVTPEISDNFSYLLGSHSLKVGFAYRGVLDREAQSPSAIYTFPTIASYLAAASGVDAFSYSTFNQSLGQPSLTYNSAFYTGYAQDDWKIRPNITLLYGVRYDLYDVPSGKKSAAYELSRNFHVDENNIAPRIGLAIGIGRDQRTVLRASGGLFYDPPQTDIYRRALLQDGQVPPVTIGTGPKTVYAPAFPTVFNSLPSGFNVPTLDVISVAPDFATLYSANANLSLSRQLARDIAITATYLHTKGNRLPVYSNINLLPSGVFLADGRPIYSTNHIDQRFNNILPTRSIGQSSYNALNVTVNRRFSAGLESFASYTWSHAIDDAPEQNNIDSASQVPEDPSDLRRDRGNSLTDRRQTFTVSEVWEPSFSVQSGFWRYLVNNNRLSSLFTAYAGDIFNVGSRATLNGDPSIAASLQRPLFIGRNTYLGPPTYQFDFRYSRIFPVGERLKPEFLAEFTNIFNHTNVTGVNTTATTNGLGVTTIAPSYAWTSALDQRLVQFGVRAQF
jgi:hypothetical protein